MNESYQAAVRCLNSRKAAPKPSVLEMRGSDDMVKWLERVDHTVPAFDLSRMRLQTLTADQMDEVNALDIIHVSGTNGKGSVCAFTSSFLRTYSRLRQYPRTVGLYTSPHIETVRERIRINGEPISEELFAKRFFEVWNKLPKESSKDLDVPRYLQLLALLSFHVFISEKVDVGIYETHLGGEYDATNIVVKPIATAVTTIADDHMNLLGPTIEDIAWHKSGIFKEEVPAFSSPQTTLVEKVLRKRAADRNTTLDIVTLNHTLEGKTYLRLPNVQKTNCSLALALVNAYIRAKISIVQQPISATELLASCQNPIWPGRFQHICKDNLQLYIDGAHNASGISHAVEWYADSVSKIATQNPTRILIFSHFSRRSVDELLRCVASHLRKNEILVHNVIFTSYNTGRDGINSIERNLQNRYDPKVLEECRLTWQVLEQRSTIFLCDTIEKALKKAGDLANNAGGAEALILGSLHLVSGILCLLGSAE